MPTDLSITAIAAVPNASEVHPEPKTVPAPVAPAEKPALSTPIYANPKLYLDPQLELVVMEFRDTSGKATTTFPSQRQMQAYRTHQEETPSAALPAMPDTPAAMPGQDTPSGADAARRQAQVPAPPADGPAPASQPPSRQLS